jgi:hypothetical protein
MSNLERTYRDALRWYPKRWRRRNEDAVVGTLLDAAEEDHRAIPARGELANLRANALATRLGPLGRIPAPVRDRVAALTTGLGAGIAIVALVATAIQRAAMPRLELPGIFPAPWTIGYDFAFYGAWILALVAGVLGLQRVARSLLLATIAISVGGRALFLALHLGVTSTTTTIMFLGALALLGLIGNPFGARRGRTWTAVSAVLWAAFVGFTDWYKYWTKGAAAGSWDWFLGPLSQWMGFALPFVIILALILWRAKKTPWAPAILIVEIPLILFAALGWQHLTALLNVAAFGVAIAATLVGCWAILRGFGVRISITRV